MVQLPSKGVRGFTNIRDKCCLVKYSTNSTRKGTELCAVILSIFTKNFCKQGCLQFIQFYIFAISLIIFVWIFVASLQALVEGSSLSSKAWLDRRP